MQTNLLIIDNQDAIPSKRPGHGKGLGKGLIEEGQEQGREGTDFFSTYAEVANEQQSHPGSAGDSKIDRKESENGEAESEDLKKDANTGSAKAGKTLGHFLRLDRKAGARSGNERVVRGEALPESGKGSLSKLKGINKGTQGLNQADHKTSTGPDKANPSKADLSEFGLGPKQGKSEVAKGEAKPQGLETVDGLLHEMGAKSKTKSQEHSKVASKPQGLEKAEGLLHETGAKSTTKNQEHSKVASKPQGLEKAEGLLHETGTRSATKNQGALKGMVRPQGLEKVDGPFKEFGEESGRMSRGAQDQVILKVATKPQGLEKAEGLLHETGAESTTKGQGVLRRVTKAQGIEKVEGLFKEFGEESGRINRGAQGQEKAAQKLRVSHMKGSPEEIAMKEPGAEVSAPKLGMEPKDARSETVKMKVLGGDLTHKKVEKTESNSGENSNFSSRNYSTPDKGTGAISHSKEPYVFAKSSQADTLKQIVKKAAFNLENGRSEFKIDLKPESLGHLKMQILTENHHVTVRILTQNPLVKDMIESNLGQLKANFQNQGLEIEKFDVSVAQDSDQNGAGDGRYEAKGMREKTGDTGNGYGGKAEEAEEVDVSMRRGQQKSAVDFFA